MEQGINNNGFTRNELVLAKMFESMAASGLAGYYLERNKELERQFENLDPRDTKTLEFGRKIVQEQRTSLMVLDNIRNGKYRLVLLGLAKTFGDRSEGLGVSLNDISEEEADRVEAELDSHNETLNQTAMDEAIKAADDLNNMLTSPVLQLFMGLANLADELNKEMEKEKEDDENGSK